MEWLCELIQITNIGQIYNSSAAKFAYNHLDAMQSVKKICYKTIIFYIFYS